MNTDPLTSALQSALPKYAAWIAVAALAIPHVTRWIYALYSGRGFFGALHGVFFGTNSAPNLIANVNANQAAIVATAKSLAVETGDPRNVITNQVIAPLQNQPKVNP